MVFGAASAPDYVVGKYKSLRKWLTAKCATTEFEAAEYGTVDYEAARMGTANTVDNASLQVPLVSSQSLELSDGLTGESTTAELSSRRQIVCV